MKAFCTLFDSRYLSRGLAMYESLTSLTPDSHLYIFPFDDEALRILRALDLPAATIVPLAEFEDAELLRVKSARSPVEYCWTCTPSIVRYCIHTYALDMCTYVDADTFFFADATVLLDEMGAADAMIIEHRYTPEHDSSATSGIYNVQFMPFRATAQGSAILEWWRDACLESCELKPEEGKCGDQKYLDDWTERFAGHVHVLRHLGGGVAPWNVQQYTFFEAGKSADGKVRGKRLADSAGFDLVFYHFHALKPWDDGRIQPTNTSYVFDASVMRLIYAPYLAHLSSIATRLRNKGVALDPHGAQPAPRVGLRARLRETLGRLLGRADANDGNANRPTSFKRALRLAPPGAIVPRF
ncbi:MAG TPA: hypothetical protein VGN52_12220 [Burkholderiales bacterium]|jgi:hypothetical protein